MSDWNKKLSWLENKICDDKVIVEDSHGVYKSSRFETLIKLLHDFKVISSNIMFHSNADYTIRQNGYESRRQWIIRSSLYEKDEQRKKMGDIKPIFKKKPIQKPKQ